MAQNLDSFLAVSLSASSSAEWSSSEENDEPERKKRKLNEEEFETIAVQFVEHTNTLSAVNENLWTGPFELQSLVRDVQLFIISKLGKYDLLALRLCNKHFLEIVSSFFLKMVVRLNRARPSVPTFYDTGKVFGFDIEDSEVIGISENVLPYIPDTVMSLTLKYGRRILHTLSEDVSPMLPRCLVYLEATCLNWTQEGVSHLPSSLQTLKELFWNKDIPEITHIDLRHLTNLTELSITRPQGKLILPSSLHTCYITSWRFRFKPERLVHLSEASNLRELHLKDCYVVSDLMTSLPKSLTSLMLTECTIENSVVSQIPNTITKLGFDKCRKLSSSGLQNIPASVVHVLMGFPLHLPWEATVPLNFSDMKFLPNTVTKLTLMNYRMVYTDSLCLPQGLIKRCCEPTFGSLTSNVKEVWLQECFYDTGRKMLPLDFKLRNERYTLRIT